MNNQIYNIKFMTNLTGRGVYQKSTSSKSKPTKEQLAFWQKLVALGCCVCGSSNANIHHAFTGSGGRKNHDLVIPLCYDCHQGSRGIHTIGRKKWQELYGYELDLLEKSKKMIFSKNNT